MKSSDLTKALESLDQKLTKRLRLVLGGGGAMILAYGDRSSTGDMDVIALPYRPLAEFDLIVTKIAEELALPGDWLNSHFSDFTYVLPDDFESRLRPLFAGSHLTVDVFGPEDMIILKCMAGRNKDRSHLRRLLRQPNLNLSRVEDHLQKLSQDGLERARSAITLFEELRDELVD